MLSLITLLQGIGLAYAAGLNLYATVAVTGLAVRLGWVQHVPTTIEPFANLFVIGAIGAVAYIGLDWVAGLFWFLLKTYTFVFVLVWMRGTLPRVRIDQLMDFAWKWLLPASLLNLLVTAAAIVIVDSVRPS